MGWFGSVSGAQVDEFARLLAREVAQGYPASREQEASNKDRPEPAWPAAVQTVFVKAREFREEHKLGIYKKARLANTFRWELKEMGYSDRFVEKTTEGLVVNMTGKR